MPLITQGEKVKKKTQENSAHSTKIWERSPDSRNGGHDTKNVVCFMLFKQDADILNEYYTLSLPIKPSRCAHEQTASHFVLNMGGNVL